MILNAKSIIIVFNHLHFLIDSYYDHYKTEIILSSEQKLVTYTNLKGEKSEYPLATALDNKNAEMAKRLKYTKEILTHMLNGTNLPPNAGA